MTLFSGLLGAILVIIGYISSKFIVRIIKKIKIRLPKIAGSDISKLQKEVNELRNALNDLYTEVQLLKDVTTETQKNNVLLFPERFDHDEAEGKTIFVKEGEEKPYDTINWRSR